MPDSPEKPEKSDYSVPPPRLRPKPRMTTSAWWLLAALLIAAAFIYAQTGNGRSEIDYGFFRQQLEKDKNIASVNVEGLKVYGEFTWRPWISRPNRIPAARPRI